VATKPLLWGKGHAPFGEYLVSNSNFQQLDFSGAPKLLPDTQRRPQAVGQRSSKWDLNGAQQAFDALAALGRMGPFANSEPFSKSSARRRLTPSDKALQSGNLAAAQTALLLWLRDGTFLHRRRSPNPSAIVNLSGAQPSTTTATDNASSIYQQLQAFRQQRRAISCNSDKPCNLATSQRRRRPSARLLRSGNRAPIKTVRRRTRRSQSRFPGHRTSAASRRSCGSTIGFLEPRKQLWSHDPQAQNAISAYNSGVTEIIINFNANFNTNSMRRRLAQVVEAQTWKFK